MAPGSRGGGGSVKGKSSPRPAPGGGGNISKRKHQWKTNHFKKGWGSVKEGRGFAFQQKEKVKREYKKLLRKEKAQRPQEIQYTENYPDHLRHLYLAEEELLKNHSKKARKNQTVAINQTDSQEEGTKKKKSKSSYQKTKEEYEKRRAEHIKRKEEAEKNQRAKEEAQRKYKEQKLEKYKILSKKTRKGQPNLNIQMEYLLQKIQDNRSIK